ncbi:MAG: ABC transporter permease [Anaerolineae bacterium]
MSMTVNDSSQNASQRANTPDAPEAKTAALKLAKPHSQWYFVRRQLLRDKAAMFGGILLIIILLLTIFAPILAPYDPVAQSENSEDRLASPSATHLMGTDDLRRDIFSRILYGGQTTLRVGIISVIGAVSTGLVLGLLSGYFGGRLDDIISRFLDTLMTLPGILLAIVIIAILGTGLNNAMLAVAVSNMPTIARLVRGDTMVEKNKVYIEASRAMGASHAHIMFIHILPNVIQSVIVIATLHIASAIQIAAGLSFLGLGAQPPNPEWGAMLNDGRDFMRSGQWWMTVFPGLAIFLTVIAINLLGDGLRDALDPRLRGQERSS